MLLLLWIIACEKEEPRVLGGCDSFKEFEEQPAPGWTSASGCRTVCQDVDAGGLVYADCYVTSDNQVMCQYYPACD